MDFKKLLKIQADSVQFLDNKGKTTTNEQKSQNEATSPNDDLFKGAGEPIDINSDDLPF